jgi:protein tyrosine phosphatase (PTP) superfamily phosphohydrolase (DUF442 family)
MSAISIPEKCQKTLVCLRPDKHDGNCQPANRREQAIIRSVLAGITARGNAGVRETTRTESSASSSF